MKIRLAAILLLLLQPAPLSAQSDPLAGLPEWLERALRDWEVPGLALAVVRGDSVIYARGFGVREVGRPDRVDERTLFAIGSASKAFTAAAVGVLVDEGKLHWDDKVTAHLPGFRVFDAYVTHELTLRDLLTHRSGLARGDQVWYGGVHDRDEVVRRVRHLQPSWSFRSTFGYQNIMYLTAGEVIEAKSGGTWDAFVKERFFTPLGMAESSTSTNDLRGKPNVATPHAKLDGTVRPVAWRNIDNVAAAGSINSNVSEMAQWVRLHLADGKIGERSVFSDSVAREVRTPQIPIRPEGPWGLIAPDANFLAYGMGWFMHDHAGHRIVHHGGNIDGNSAMVAFIPEEKLGMVVLTNMNSTSLTSAVVHHVFDALLGVPVERDWSERVLEARRRLDAQAEAQQRQQDSAHVKGTSPSLALDAYAGTYSDSLYGDAKVSLEGGKLVLRYQSAFTGDLTHWHYDTFQVKWRDPILGRALLTFTLDERGRPVSVRTPPMEFRRVNERSANTRASR
jgi:CubicO group peptidase (beta-lactamase class C family)